MKRMILVVTGVVVIAGMVFWVKRPIPTTVSAEQSNQDAVTREKVELTQTDRATKDAPASKAAQGERNHSQPSNGAPTVAPEAALEAETAARMAFKHSMDTLISSQSTHEQRHEAWKQLIDAGQLDQAIAELQQRMASDTQSAQLPGALGEAYLNKCGLTTDVREQAIMAMNADQLFETALKLDPTDWEARYTRAIAMSYWPANLNKGQDVIDNFQTLIQQQDNQAPQMQYALPYLHLGDEYQKAGNTASALEVWQRGAALFPANEDLRSRLASAR